MAPVTKRKKKTYSSSDESLDESPQRRQPVAGPSRSESRGHNEGPSLSEETKKMLTALRGRTSDPFGEGSDCIQELYNYVMNLDPAAANSEGFMSEMGIMLESCTNIFKKQVKATEVHVKQLANDANVYLNNEPEAAQAQGVVKTKKTRQKKKVVEPQLTVVTEENNHTQITTDEISPNVIQTTSSCPVPTAPCNPFPQEGSDGQVQNTVAQLHEEGQIVENIVQQQQPISEEGQIVENIVQQQQPNSEEGQIVENIVQQQQPISEEGQIVENPVSGLNVEPVPMDTLISSQLGQLVLEELNHSNGGDLAMEPEGAEVHVENELNTNDIPVETPVVGPTESVAGPSDSTRMSRKVTQKSIVVQSKQGKSISKSKKQTLMPTLTPMSPCPFNDDVDDDPPRLRPSVRRSRTENEDSSLVINDSNNQVEPNGDDNQNETVNGDWEESHNLVGVDTVMIDVSSQDQDLTSSTTLPISDASTNILTDDHSMEEARSVEQNHVISQNIQTQPIPTVSMSSEDEELVNGMVQNMEREYNSMILHGPRNPATSTSNQTLMKILENLKMTLTNKYNIQFNNNSNNYYGGEGSSQNYFEPAMSQSMSQQSFNSTSFSQETSEFNLERIRTKVETTMAQISAEAFLPTQTREESLKILQERLHKMQSSIIQAYRYYPLAASHTYDFIGRINEFINDMEERLKNEDVIEFEIDKYEEEFLQAANQEVEDSQQSSPSSAPSIFFPDTPKLSTRDLTEEDIAINEYQENSQFSQFSFSSLPSLSNCSQSIVRNGKTWVPISKVLERLLAKNKNRKDLARYFFATISLLNSGNIELHHEPGVSDLGEQTDSINIMLEDDTTYVYIKKSQSCRTNFQETLDSTRSTFSTLQRESSLDCLDESDDTETDL